MLAIAGCRVGRGNYSAALTSDINIAGTRECNIKVGNSNLLLAAGMGRGGVYTCNTEQPA